MNHEDLPPDLSGVRSFKEPARAGSSNRIDWSYWANLSLVDYGDACILSRGFDPRAIKGNALPSHLDAELKRLVSIAKSHLGSQLPAYSTENDRYYGSRETGVRLGEFRTWGESLPIPFTFPEDFPKASPKVTDASAHSWPWGTHETELLRKLAEAVRRYWVNYDPTDPSTASTNETVKNWLKQQGVADRAAEVMAQIIRADGLRPGPR
ncbi:hypothetical protein [Rhodanobacter sp. Root561]|uniref:hypothetical protein n=1 Tax=Rhodanobacter sp. Root561 TaxID=1736560 RepID=UPI000A7E8208|nr:hypothetical protein [Rhodanobacter sp. Root561]